MALTDVLVAIVIKISLLVLKSCSMSQFFAMRFAFNSSSRVMPPFTAAAAITDIPPVKIAAIFKTSSPPLEPFLEDVMIRFAVSLIKTCYS